VLLSIYVHLIEENAERERVDPELEIAKARDMNVHLECVCATEERSAGIWREPPATAPRRTRPQSGRSDCATSRTLSTPPVSRTFRAANGASAVDRDNRRV